MLRGVRTYICITNLNENIFSLFSLRNIYSARDKTQPELINLLIDKTNVTLTFITFTIIKLKQLLEQ